MTDNYAIITVPAAMLRAALVCASTEQARYYLNGVYVDPKGFLVSTDGHRAFVGRIDIDADQAPFDGWIIPRDAIKLALAGYKADTIEITQTRVGVVSCKPVDGSFPDWRRVIPTELNGATAQFNPVYIADMGKIGEMLTGKRKNGGLTAHIHHNGDAPAGVTFPGCESAFAVLMPIRSQHTDTSDAWAIATKAVG
jgi:DNA polymerase III subunit beta